MWKFYVKFVDSASWTTRS